MSWNKWVRQIHRWLSIAFTAGVVVNFVAVGQEEYPLWAGLMALVPLAGLLLSGLYLFALPYAARWRGARRTVT
jgi:high-affinity Fe2+/Pb2+ permease